MVSCDEQIKVLPRSGKAEKTVTFCRAGEQTKFSRGAGELKIIEE